jgi:hypothetical protein
MASFKFQKDYRTAIRVAATKNVVFVVIGLGVVVSVLASIIYDMGKPH